MSLQFMFNSGDVERFLKKMSAAVEILCLKPILIYC